MTTSQSEHFDLDREQSIERNVDAFGRQWKISTIRGSNLYRAFSEQLRADAATPELIDGRWTKVPLLETRIRQYVADTWRMADEKAKKAAGKARAKKAAEEEKDSAATADA